MHCGLNVSLSRTLAAGRVISEAERTVSMEVVCDFYKEVVDGEKIYSLGKRLLNYVQLPGQWFF